MMQNYAHERASTLLRRLAFRMSRAARLRDADSIHDLRVTIRRFEQCLRIFRQFYPGHQKKIHRRLRWIMNLTGEIRNRDIALELLRQAGFPAGSALPARLLRERKEIQAELMEGFDRWGRHELYRKWGSRLGL